MKSFDRREFLRVTGAAAAAAAFPTVIPSSAFGANERVRLGFIGVRNRGMQNLKPLMQHAVAVCDVDSKVLEAAKAAVEKANGKCEAYSDYRKLLESKDIDAVVISTPDHWHAIQTIDACAAGKDVFCEKPLTLTLDEGKAMIKAARKYNRIVQTGSQQRSGLEFQKAVELVRGGTIGKVHTVRVGLPGVNMTGPAVPDSNPPPELDFNFWLGPAPDRPYNANRVHYYFRFFWNYSGGQQTNFGAHHLDIAQWGLGMDESGPVSAEGTAKYHPTGLYEVPATFSLTYTYANGVKLICGSGPEFRGGTLFEGDKGSVYVNRGRLEVKPGELFSEPTPKNNAEAAHYANFLECIKTRKLPICDLAIGHRSATVCHLGNIALRSGRKVTWDPVKEQITGDREQAQMAHYGYRSPWKLG
jgi:predicted dehydrogenase